MEIEKLKFRQEQLQSYFSEIRTESMTSKELAKEIETGIKPAIVELCQVNSYIYD